jgi:group I intron endonuclease
MKYYIYGLYSSQTGELRYIGQTSWDLNKRLKGHIKEVFSKKRNQTHKINWLKLDISAGFWPYIQLLQEFDNENDLNKAEIYWIKFFNEEGCNLTNQTTGGYGVRGYKFTDEVRAKMSRLGKGRKKPDKYVQLMKIRMLGNSYGSRISSAERENRRQLMIARDLKGPNNHMFGKIYSQEELIKNSRLNGGKSFIEINTGNIYHTQRGCAKELSIDQASIWRVLNGKQGHVSGFVFKYLNKNDPRNK